MTSSFSNPALRAPAAALRCPAPGLTGRSLVALLLVCLSFALAACSTVRVHTDRAHGGELAAHELVHHAETARRAYAQLFFAAQPAGADAVVQRAKLLMEYNDAAEQLTQLLFEHRSRARPDSSITIGAWQFRRAADEPLASRVPTELVAAARLRVGGFKNVHRRGGVGAPFVAVLGTTEAEQTPAALIESPFVAATVVVRFPGETAAEVLAGTVAIVSVYDPLRTETIPVGGEHRVLAADFTAPYALWLARSKFERVARSALLRRSSELIAPRIYALQPYEASRRTIVLLHGLGGSPATWVDLVNDVMADSALRSRYQIWQVFYPTSLPLPEARQAVREALLGALAAVDPEGDDPATDDLTLIGHSMGGVIARLLVVESGDALWQELFTTRLATLDRGRYTELAPYLTLEPLPQVSTAIFLSAPHRGSPLAADWRGKLAALFVRLPVRTMKKLASLTAAVAANAPNDAREVRRRPTSVNTLGNRDPYLRVTATLPIAPAVAYHTIVGHTDTSKALAESTDGVVPYSSAHLDGAQSELVVDSGHALQNTPEAIREIRRILGAARS